MNKNEVFQGSENPWICFSKPRKKTRLNEEKI